MTRFAFALKCGCFGARGFAPAIAPETFGPASNDPSAIEPSPTPHCCKNQRRVISFACSTRNSCSKDNREFMVCGETTLLRRHPQPRTRRMVVWLLHAYTTEARVRNIRWNGVLVTHAFPDGV